MTKKKTGWLYYTLMVVLLCSPIILAADQAKQADDQLEVMLKPANPITEKDKIKKPASSHQVMPGITINTKKKYVDVDAVVCLRNGILELVACAPNSKEHESIVSLRAKAQHMHMALLMLGARPGKPGGWVKKADTFAEVKPTGDKIKISLMIPDKKKKWIEKPISYFVCAYEERKLNERGLPVELDGDTDNKKGEKKPVVKNKPPVFSDEFIFCGSRLHKTDDGKLLYLADQEGNVISVATFGDETLALPDVASASNDSLMWQANKETVPPLGTKVKVRLRVVAVKKKPVASKGKLKSKGE